MPPRTIREYLAGPPRVTQRDLAQRAGVNQSMISMVARGRRLPRGPLAIRLHEATGIPLEAILTPSPQPAPPPRPQRHPYRKLPPLAKLPARLNGIARDLKRAAREIVRLRTTLVDTRAALLAAVAIVVHYQILVQQHDQRLLDELDLETVRRGL